MRTSVLLASLFSAFCLPVLATDYSKVVRSVGKEPVYQKSPLYALLLFGKEAKLRVWAVLDGQTIYIDRDSNGDLTGKDERFARIEDCRDIELRDPDGKTRYFIKHISTINFKEPARELIVVDIEIKGPLSYRQYCGVELRGRPDEAKVAHFHGPLTMGPLTVNGKLREDVKLVTGDQPSELQGHVGTLNDAHGCWVVVRSHNGQASALPKGVFPVVDVEFPSKAPGGPPVKKQYLLDKFC